MIFGAFLTLGIMWLSLDKKVDDSLEIGKE